jgi:hypothetical protein
LLTTTRVCFYHLHDQRFQITNLVLSNFCKHDSARHISTMEYSQASFPKASRWDWNQRTFGTNAEYLIRFAFGLNFWVRVRVRVRVRNQYLSYDSGRRYVVAECSSCSRAAAAELPKEKQQIDIIITQYITDRD